MINSKLIALNNPRLVPKRAVSIDNYPIKKIRMRNNNRMYSRITEEEDESNDDIQIDPKDMPGYSTQYNRKVNYNSFAFFLAILVIILHLESKIKTL